MDTEPLNCDAICVLNEPDSSTEEVNGVKTLKPSTGLTDAVTEPDLISADINASSVRAERGISNNNLPDELTNEPLAIKILPLNVEPLSTDSTKNPNSGVTDAVILPLAIRNTSSDNAERGISNNPLPLPLNIEDETGPDVFKLPVICVFPMNVISGAISKKSTILSCPTIDECNWQL